MPTRDGFFLFRVPDEVLAQGGPDALVAYDRRGRELGRLDLGTPFPPHAAFLGIQRPPGGAELARRRAVVERVSPAGRARIWIAPSGAAPAQCYWLTLGSNIFGGGCRRYVPKPRGLWHVVPARFTVRHRDVAILWGQVGTDVRALELRFQDGKHQRVAIEHGFYLYPVRPARFVFGHRPAFLVARAASGRVLAKRLLWQYTIDE